MQVFLLLPTEVGLAAATDVCSWQDLAQRVCFVTIYSLFVGAFGILALAHWEHPLRLPVCCSKLALAVEQ